MNATTATRSPSILLVEDDDNHAVLAQLAMEDSEFECDLVRVSDGYEAMAYLRGESPFENTRQPDMMLLDLQMPGMDGHEVLKAVRQDRRFVAMPIIILTTSESSMDIQQAYEGAANSYLVKPVEFESFNQMMRDVQRYWTTWNRTNS